MITIVRGNEKIVCSYKTYDEQFRQHGYEIVSAPKKAPVKKVEVKAEPVLQEEKKEEVKEVAENKEIVNEEDKIGSKYGVKRRNTTKKEA